MKTASFLLSMETLIAYCFMDNHSTVSAKLASGTPCKVRGQLQTLTGSVSIKMQPRQPYARSELGQLTRQLIILL